MSTRKEPLQTMIFDDMSQSYDRARPESYVGREDQYREPKEQLKTVLRLMHDDLGDSPLSLLDVGCASGAFLYHALRQLNIRRAAGIDVSEASLEQASRWVPEAEFVRDSILVAEHEWTQQFDVCTCIGTLSVFDDLELVLGNLVSSVRPGGRLYLLDLVNDFPIDVVMRYRDVRMGEEAEWLSDFNVRSRLTYERILERLRPGVRITWTDFEMPFALPATDDPLKAWTIRTERSPHQGVVGTGTLLFYKVASVVLP